MRTFSAANAAANFSPDANRCSLQDSALRQVVGPARKPRQDLSLKLLGGGANQQQDFSLVPTSKFHGQFRKPGGEQEESTLIKKLQLHLSHRDRSTPEPPSKETAKPSRPHRDLASTILQYKKTGTKAAQSTSRQSALQLISSLWSADDIKKRLKHKHTLPAQDPKLDALPLRQPSPLGAASGNSPFRSKQPSGPPDSKSPQHRFAPHTSSTKRGHKLHRAKSSVFVATVKDGSSSKNSAQGSGVGAGLSPSHARLADPSLSVYGIGSLEPKSRRDAKTDRNLSFHRPHQEDPLESAAAMERSLAPSSLLQSQQAMRTSSSMYLYCQKLKYARVTQVADQAP